jgi:WD40 repeat protein
LLDEIAHGGMGVVYRARQVSLNRAVAVKMMLLGQFAGKAAFERFRAEAETAARLQHPNIVAIHEIGEADGQPYFSMDYVAGRNLAELVRDRPLPARQAAGYVRTIAQAVQYAHTQGVLHRDLKPANVLIDEFDEPRITDFGLAKRLTSDSSLATDHSSLTLTGQVIGSPNFLPPEQAGKGGRVGLASDIYGLGALLYYLLTARPPFVAETFEATLAQVLNTDPAAPRQLNPGIPLDLETLCLRCLEKDPARRYASAAELADELDRFLKGEPIRARPIGTIGRTWRWCRRKPALAAMAGAVVALLLTVTVVSVTSAWRIATARKGEQREAYYSNIALANQYIEQGSIDRALETLWKCPPQYRHWEWGHLLYLCHQDAASFQAHATNVTATFFSPDSKWVVSQDAAGLAKVWDWEAEEQVFAFGSSSNRAGWIAFHPSGSQLAAAMGTNGVSVWSTADWQTPTNLQVGLAVPSVPLPAQPLTRSSTTLSPSDGERAGVRGRSGATTNGQPLFTLHPQGGEVTTLAYSPDGHRLVTGGADGTVAVWDSAFGQQLNRLETTNQPIRRVAVSPDGQRLVAVAERAAWVWDLQSGKQLRSFPDDSVGPTSQIVATFADDTGENFATVDATGQFVLRHEGAPPQHLITIQGSQPTLVRRVFFGPDSHLAINAGEDNTARLWELPGGAERLTINERVHQVSFNADGSKMVTLGTQNWVTVWDLTKRRKLKVLRGHERMVQSAAISRDGRLVATGDEGGKVKVWSASLGREFVEDDVCQNIAVYSPDGQRIASDPDCWIVQSSQSGRVLLRVVPANELIMAMAFSPDGHRIVTAGSHKSAKVWDVDSGRLLLTLRGHRRQVYRVAYSRDGRFIATGSVDGTARIWDAHSGAELRTLHVDPKVPYAITGYWHTVTSLEFDATTSRLITGTPGGRAQAWDLKTGALLTELRGGREGDWSALKLHPDGKRVVIQDMHGLCRMWDMESGRLIQEWRGRGVTLGMDISADGRRLIAPSSAGTAHTATFGYDSGTLEVWDIEGPPREALTLSGREAFWGAAFSPDPEGRRIVAASLDFGVHQWETLPWKTEAYAEEAGQKSEVRGQESESRGPKTLDRGREIESGLAERVRRYARRYWRERLAAEREVGVRGTPPPEVIEIPVDRALFPKRDPGATPGQIDLTDYYTGELTEPFFPNLNGDRQDNDLSALPSGLLSLEGAWFDVRGVIQLRRAEPRGGPFEVVWRRYPVRINGIPVQQEFRRIHLLLGAAYAETEGTVVGNLVLHYADGATGRLDLVYARDVRDWWWDPNARVPEETDRGKVVWTGSNPVVLDANRSLRLYLTSLDNPFPGFKVVSIDLVSAMSESAPFLIALTVE